MAVENLLEIRVVRSFDKMGEFMGDHILHALKRLLCKLDIEDGPTWRT